MRHVQTGDDCWLWTGAGTRYGSFRIGRKMIPAHRVSWTLERGEIPNGLFVLHRCDVGLCVKPDRLFLGTQTDNMHDMQAKNRHNPPIGERARAAVLDVERVIYIRDEYFSGRKTQMELTSEFNMTHTGIGHVLKRESWNHLPPSAIEQNPCHIVDSIKASEWIIATRKSLNVSQTALALASGITQDKLSRLEHCHNQWSIKDFTAVKSALEKLS